MLPSDFPVRDEAAAGSSPAPGQAALIAWAIALILHLAFAATLLLSRGDWGPAAPPPALENSRTLALELVPPPEAEMAAAVPAAFASLRHESPPESFPPPAPLESVKPPLTFPEKPPDPPPARPEPPRTTAKEIDDDIRRELENDRREALAEASRIERQAAFEADRVISRAKENQQDQDRQSASAASDAPSPKVAPRSIPVGTIRELDLSGYPQPAADAVMKRYGLRITERALAGGVSQTFLSSASTADGGRFLSDRAGASSSPGIYQVFLISPKAVAVMSRLEEAELQKRGLDPLKTRVTRVKFGLVGSPDSADLGVLLFESEPVGG